MYFVAIGSQDYTSGSRTNFSLTDGLPTTPTPANSASEVAQALSAQGAQYGILLTSDQTHFVSRSDVLTSLSELKTQIRRDQPRNPVIVFYYMGHGLGDQYNRFLYLIPGDLVFDKIHDANQTDSIMLLKETVWNYDIIVSLLLMDMSPSRSYLDTFYPTNVMPDLSLQRMAAREPPSMLLMQIGMKVAAEFSRIKQEANRLQAEQDGAKNSSDKSTFKAVPYVILFDNCYGDVTQDIVGPKLLAGENFISRFLTLFSQISSEYLDITLPKVETGGVVLYATRPGTSIGDFPDPSAKQQGSDPRVGPLARRLLVLLKGQQARGALTLGSFLNEMRSSDLAHFPDGGTTPVPYSISMPMGNGASTILFNANKSVKPKQPVEPRLGSGSQPIVCCGLVR